MKKSFCL